MPPRLPVLEANERVREIAFAFLLNDSQPVSPDELSAAAGGNDIGAILNALSEAGWIDRSEDGRVTGSAGLSLSDGPHRLTIGQRPFRTWCAYDALGIPAALNTSAYVETACGVCGKAIAIEIIDGRPNRTGPERLWLAAGGDDLRTSFCTPTVLLCGAEHSAVWAAKHDKRGDLLALNEASEQGASDWASPADVARRLGIRVEFVGGPRDSQRDRLTDTPGHIDHDGGHYERSVRCADDGALRYVWREFGPLTLSHDPPACFVDRQGAATVLRQVEGLSTGREGQRDLRL